ncbi:MFS transporter [Mesorhizobium sp. LHD-90]|uniref:MFS transporter n=1 Tax=Mesorhizobium sp. LHD-90 TaxID=3071414 RepID=UPI0027E1C3AD|nr:MFS transporter [Mesorhizobium sp. LHD-90]MDQ6433049.1 MFS transporter [Mesorhizobium sp. LHD-90]
MTAAPPQTENPEMPVAAIAGIIATVAVFAISQGLSYPLLSFILQRQGVSPALIGMSAAMTPLGFILSSFFIPAMSRHVGSGRLAVFCALSAAVLLVAIAWRQDALWWFPLRFLLGFAANPLYVISETWMIAMAPAERRGRLMGVYASIVSAGFALGPVTLAIVGTEGWAPFLVGVAAFLLCALILLLALPRLPEMQDEKPPTSVAGFVLVAPLLLFAVFTAAAFEQALLALFSVYGEAHGSSETRIATLLAVFIAGNVALQIPLGALAERVGAIKVMLLCAVVAVGGCALLPMLLASSLIWPVAFVWGAVAFGIYTMGLIMLGERFSGPMLMTGNAAFALVWGLGGIAGPPVTGAIMDLIGVEGLPLALGLLCGSLVVCILAGLALPKRGASA